MVSEKIWEIRFPLPCFFPIFSPAVFPANKALFTRTLVAFYPGLNHCGGYPFAVKYLEHSHENSNESGLVPLAGYVKTRVGPWRRLKFMQFLHINSGVKAYMGWYFHSIIMILLRVFFLGGGGFYNRTSHHAVILYKFSICHLSSPCFQFLFGRKVGLGQVRSKPHAIAD